MIRSGRLALLAFGAVTSTACWVLVGIEERPVDAGQEAATTPETMDRMDARVVVDGGFSCTCLPEVPAGWDGPVVLDGLSPQCAPPWDRGSSQVHSGLDAGVHSCACSCAAPAPTCLMYSHYFNGCEYTCGLPDAGTNISASQGTCFRLWDNCRQSFRLVASGGGACAPDASMVRTTPRWEQNMLRCEGPVAHGLCAADEPCVPAAPATGAHCIAHVGALPCPPSYPDRGLYFGRYDDTRGCTPCTCNETGGPCALEMYDDAGCAPSDYAGTAVLGNCVKSKSFAKLVRTSRACSANGAAAVGQVTPLEPVTYCCRTR
jgi:hypothetical protein